MMKINYLLFMLLFTFTVNAQKIHINAGIISQKTEALYWENGVGADFSFPSVLRDQLHLKIGYTSSRLGTALVYNALKQDNLVIGFDWHFMAQKNLQITTGLNTGMFLVDYGSSLFNDLPASSPLFQIEAGLSYKFKFPVTTSLTAGYNLISGDGVTVPGSLFPVFYKLSVFYRFK